VIYMERLSLDTIKSYFEINDPTCISIYMPTHRTGNETRQDQIRFKNLLQKVEDTLKERGYRDSEVDKLLKPILDLKQETPLWQHMSDGFVIFRSENHFSYNQFPVEFSEMAVVQHRFHLKPLLPLMTGNGLYYVLGLSQNKITLFEGSKFNIKEIDTSFLPENLVKALNIDEYFDSVQFHSGTNSGRAERASIFHGHGGAEEDQKEFIRQFFREINKNLTPFLTDREVPLILAGVEYLHPIYHEVNDHKGLLESGVTGNPDQYSNEELHEKSWQIVSKVFDDDLNKARKNASESKNSKKVTTELDTVLKSAHQGRIDTLFVAIDEYVKGRYDETKLELRLETKEETPEDLLDLCSIKTLLNGGTVYGLNRNDMPDGYQTVAILRY
jgi:hypothetical protein